MPVKPEKLIIPLTGIAAGEQPVRGIYGPLNDKIIDSLGKKEGSRASHVEFGCDLSQDALVHLPLFTAKIPGQLFPSITTHRKIHDTVAAKWFADMTPSGGEVLGPFDDRDTALAKEVIWLEEHHIPVCETCRAVSPTARHRSEPNQQEITGERELQSSRGGELPAIDYASLEADIVSHHREKTFDGIFRAAFTRVVIEGTGGLARDADTYAQIVFVMDTSTPPGASIRQELIVLFEPNSPTVCNYQVRLAPTT